MRARLHNILQTYVRTVGSWWSGSKAINDTTYKTRQLCGKQLKTSPYRYRCAGPAAEAGVCLQKLAFSAHQALRAALASIPERLLAQGADRLRPSHF
jgi:hypothetical protein